jgi:hypothetical protein
VRVPNTVELQPLPTPYKVVAGSKVRIRAVVGEQQRGTILVELDGAELGEAETEIERDLGEGSQLVGKTLAVTTTVTATNVGVLRTIVTYKLTGGVAPLERFTKRDAEAQHKSVFHYAEFLFENAP